MASKTRVAVVGAGAWGAEHARIFSRRADTELVGIVGRSVERTGARAAEYGTTAFASVAEMLAEGETRPGNRLPAERGPLRAHTRAHARRECRCSSRSPWSSISAEADQLLAEAEQRGTFFAINFNHRYAEPVLRAKAAIEAGELGEIVFATWRFGGEANFGDSPHANLIETQCHGFDMLEHLCGPISSVAAQMTNTTYGAWSTVAIALEFESGAVGTMLGSYDSSYAYEDTQRIEVNGVLGRAVIHDTVRSLTLERAGDETASVWRAGYFNDEARNFHGTFDRHVDAVLAALRAGDPPPVHARAGRRALELAHAVIRSHETGERVSTPFSSRAPE